MNAEKKLNDREIRDIIVASLEKAGCDVESGSDFVDDIYIDIDGTWTMTITVKYDYLRKVYNKL